MPHYTVEQDEIEANIGFDALTLHKKAIIEYTYEDRDFWRSTSGWGAAHLAALRVLVFPDLPMDRIIPAEFHLAENSSLASDVRRLVGLPLEHVKSGQYDRLDPGRTFYNELAAFVRLDESYPSLGLNLIRSNRVPTVAALSSPSSPPSNTLIAPRSLSSNSPSCHPNRSPVRAAADVLENARQLATNNVLVAFLSLVSDVAHRINDPSQMRPDFNARPDHLTFLLAGGRVTSTNDGSGWKMRFSNSTNQWVPTGRAPMISLKCRRHHALDEHSILGQETGELLALAKLKSGYGSSEIDRQAYMVSCYNLKMYISTVYITPDYFESCNKGIIQEGQYFIIRRSRCWDLSDKDQRIEAAMAFLGVLKYTMSG